MACLHRSPRVLVTVALGNPAAGRGPDDIVISCPSISREAVRVAQCYAAGFTKGFDE